LLELDDDDKVHIIELFNEDIIPKISRLDARLGILNCEFAGDQYRNWNVHFRSVGSGFEIVEFEYDEDSVGIDLDL